MAAGEGRFRACLSEGEVLNSPSGGCRIEGVLGQGGFGITYRAEELERHVSVAVKEFMPMQMAVRMPDGSVAPKPGLEAEYELRLQSFSKEARMLASLELPSVVRALGAFEDRGTAYLVMEFIDGVPLHEKAAELGGRIPPELLLPRLGPLLRDLERMHESGLIHRDITPDNIMWTRDGALKLIDFGSARTTSSKRFTVMYKRGFAPVEQYLDSDQGPFTDVYALCATIYYLLTGVYPPEAVERLEEDAVQPPSSLGVALTPEEDAAILHGMAVQPKLRTKSMAGLARELGYGRDMPGNNTAAGGQADNPAPAPMPRPSLWQRFMSWLRGG